MSELFNASGAVDTTCAAAINLILPKPGDVWVNKNGKHYVCIKRHERFCNALLLRDVPMRGCVELELFGHGTMYANPAQLTYVNEFNYGEFTVELDPATFQSLLECISDKLGITITASEPIVETKTVVVEKPIVTSSNVNHPAHYQGKVEVIDIIESYGLNFSLGNVIKYILRHDLKGNPLEDLQKAEWYLHREVTRMDGDNG